MGQPDDDDLDFGATLKGFRAGLRLFYGRFELLRMLGRGGMGVVWLAKDRELDHEVALKFLPESMIHDEEAIADLKVETRRCMGLTHPHIVRVFDFLREESAAAVSMEYVAGQTLQQAKLEREERCFEVETIAPWIEQVCEALAYAHGPGRTVHRDLKPANVMVETASGRAKLTDFGIAGTLTDSMTRLTRGDMAASGTLVYMSPQQAMGHPPSVADDVYALGATIYELLTGKPPFNRGEILQQINHVEAPTMAERRRELGVEHAGPIPDAWEETVAACLAKEWQDRPASVTELWERLQATGKPGDSGSKPASAVPSPVRSVGERTPENPLPPETREQTGAPGSGTEKRRVGLVAAIGLVAVGVVVAGMILLQGDAEPAPEPPATVTVPSPEPSAANDSGSRETMTTPPSVAAAAAVRQELETLQADLQAAASEAEARANTATAVAGQLTFIEVEVMGSRGNGPVGKERLDEAGRQAATVSTGDGLLADRMVFTDFVMPIMKAKCIECHNGDKQKGNLRLDTHEMMMAGSEGSDYAAVMAGNSDKSELILRVLLPSDDDEFMPPLRDGTEPLTPEEIRVLRWWIDKGASKDATVAELGADNALNQALLAFQANLGGDKASVEEGGLAVRGLDLLSPEVKKKQLDEAARLGAQAQAAAAAADQEATRARTAVARAGEIGSGHPDPAIQALVRSVAEAAEPIGQSAVEAANWAAQAAESLRMVRAVAADAAAAAARPMATGPGGASKDRPWENSLGMRFVPVPIGNGPSAGQTVLFSIWETRVQDYAAFAAENPGIDMAWKDYSFEGHAQGPDHPVVNVSWKDAKAFCVWLTERERLAGRIGPLDAYRLPTDVEWSWAVGIGDREDPEENPSLKDGQIADEYPWGTGWPPPAKAGNYSGRESASKHKLDDYEDDHAFTAPVGSYAPNELGLYDLGGNVWEWCEDFYDSFDDSRVFRGASWLNDTGTFLLSSHRFYNDSALFRGLRNGLRVVVAVGVGE